MGLVTRTVANNKFIQVFRGKLKKETIFDLKCSWRGIASDGVLVKGILWM